MTFSVIVATYNRMVSLRRTLESLQRQEFRDFEVVVVNDGSTDRTDEYMMSIAKEQNIAYLSHPNQGLAATRSAGLQVVRGEYVAFTDDDCEVPPKWLTLMFETFAREHVSGIGGAAVTGDPSNPYAEANDMINNYFKAALNRDPRRAPYFTGNNMAFTRSSLLKVGGPDRRFRMGAEDRDLVHRLHSSGETLRYLDTLLITHYNDADLWRFIVHQYDQGKGSYLFYTTHSVAGKKPISIPASVYLGLLSHPFKTRSFGRAVVLFLLVIAAQCSVAIGFFTAAIFREESRHAA